MPKYLDYTGLDHLVDKFDGRYLKKCISITYSNLKTLKTNGNLVAGQWYRITDYTCTTSASNTSSAGHLFDILVRADDGSHLNENAFATHHDGDTYFANCKLEAWVLKYCFDNLTSRFAWAKSTTAGRGVIYYMKDEFGNECPYDFKNMLFTSSGKYTSAYTFSYTESRTIKDASLLSSKGCNNNVIKKYISSNKQQLNFIVFYSTNSTFSCYSNTFESCCYSNTFGNSCTFNTFNCFCNSSVFGSSCTHNTIGNNCNAITFGDNCSYNIFGNGCFYVVLGGACYHNMIGDSCTFDTFGNNCEHNIVGNYCANIICGNYCSYNNFGSNCQNINFGASTSTSDLINYCRYNCFDNGCGFINLSCSDTSASSSNYLQNVHIHSGVLGTSNNRKSIVVPDRALTYSIDYFANNSQSIILD